MTAPSEAPRALVVRDLAKEYRGAPALRGIGFEIGPGEVFGLLGPNGAGKTTTLEAIGGLIEPDSGEIRVCGVNARAHPRTAKRLIGVVLQATGLQYRITPREALRVFGALYGTSIDPADLLDRFGLTGKADARYDTLSGGQQQRLAIALAFVGDPTLLVLDEPTAGLDPPMRAEVHRHIAAMRAEGRSVLLATHDMDEAEQLCDRVAVLRDGRIVATGRPSDLVAHARGHLRVYARLSRPLSAGGAARLAATDELVIDDDAVRFTTHDLNAALTGLIELANSEAVAIVEVRAAGATLEDVIVAITSAAAVT